MIHSIIDLPARFSLVPSLLLLSFSPLSFRFSEKIVQFIDDTVRAAHASSQTLLPDSFIQEVLLLLNLLSQKDTFESLYRNVLFHHIIDCFPPSPSLPSSQRRPSPRGNAHHRRNQSDLWQCVHYAPRHTRQRRTQFTGRSKRTRPHSFHNSTFPRFHLPRAVERRRTQIICVPRHTDSAPNFGIAERIRSNVPRKIPIANSHVFVRGIALYSRLCKNRHFFGHRNRSNSSWISRR